MQPVPNASRNVEHLMPLLASIAREVRDRVRASDVLHARIERWSRNKRRHQRQLDLAWADFSIHQRELRAVQKEVERLGCRPAGEMPWHVALQDAEAGVVYEGALDKTTFVMRPARPTT
jgi:hypothetical protein